MIPGIVADALRQGIESLPADQLVATARNAGSLFDQLGPLGDVLGQLGLAP